jgi:hypothetical protein
VAKSGGGRKRVPKLTSRNWGRRWLDWMMRPENRRRRRQRYEEFLAQHPLVRAVRENDEEKIKKLFDEMGI